MRTDPGLQLRIPLSLGGMLVAAKRVHVGLSAEMGTRVSPWLSCLLSPRPWAQRRWSRKRGSERGRVKYAPAAGAGTRPRS